MCVDVCYPTAGMQHLERVSSLVAGAQGTAAGGQPPPPSVLLSPPLSSPKILAQPHGCVLFTVDTGAFT